MDSERRRVLAELRRMPSADAAEWLLSHRSSGDALVLLNHLALARKDNLRLARHFLSGLPHASAFAYEVFAKRLGVPDFAAVIRENLPADTSRLDLLLYYLETVLEKAVDSPKGEAAARDLVAHIVALKNPTTAGLQ